MGEVYKARDPRLDRFVAIKVLPDHIAHREDSRARFEREARTVASLNHPNICTLFDIGPNYMVLELLAAHIEKGALPLDQALKFAIQIADALDRAHRAGVTHRDIKPQNIMLTRDGVKLLDFGLAKSATTTGPTEATLTQVLTTEGMVVGTPQYMAPEQFEGKEADARSDIWAFGAVLYEMVTGQKAFQGKNYTSLVAAILGGEPAPMAVQPFTPAWLERFVRRCLEKDPEDRYQTMRDVVIELRKPPPEQAIVQPPAKASRWLWAVAAVTTLALLATSFGWYSATRPAPLRQLIRLSLDVPPATPLERFRSQVNPDANMLALSPDGARLAVTLRGTDGKVRIHTRLLHQSQFAPLAGTDNAHGPFFSPAGDWIGFFADGKLKKIPVEGGAAVTLCEALEDAGASWGDDDNVIVPLQFKGRGRVLGRVLARVPSGGGTPVPLTKLNAAETEHLWPQALPGSQTVLFTAVRLRAVGLDDASIEVVSLRTGERKTLLRGGFYPRYLGDGVGSGGTGYLVYLHQSTAFAVPFHAAKLALLGAGAPILDDVSSTVGGGGDFAFSQNGTFVYLSGKPPLAAWPISWVDKAGISGPPLHAPLARYGGPRFSPDGKRVAFSIATDNGQDIWVKDLGRDTLSRLSLLPGVTFAHAWTPDGKSIVFNSANPAAPGIYATRSDGSGEALRLTDGKNSEVPSAFSPDGKHLAISQRGNSGSRDIFTLPVEADDGTAGAGFRLGKAKLFLGTPLEERDPEFSPDGRWLAYTSNESGVYEVYVRPFPGPGGRWQVSAGGGRGPLWSRGSQELLFQNVEGRIMAATYTTKGDSFMADTPRVWTETRLRGYVIFHNYDLTPDGKRLAGFVAYDPENDKLPAHLTVLLNFTDEVRRKVREGK
jgi:serine/threonine-protein kinase